MLSIYLPFSEDPELADVTEMSVMGVLLGVIEKRSCDDLWKVSMTSSFFVMRDTDRLIIIDCDHFSDTKVLKLAWSDGKGGTIKMWTTTCADKCHWLKQYKTKGSAESVEVTPEQPHALADQEKK